MVQKVATGGISVDGQTFVTDRPRPAPNVSTSGLYLALGVANTDPGGVTIPTGASRVVLWFEASTSDPTMVGGRVGFNASAAAVSSITNTDALLAYHPALPVEYHIPSDATRIHLASPTANAVVRGAWLFPE